jgi:hypothetical protein
MGVLAAGVISQADAATPPCRYGIPMDVDACIVRSPAPDRQDCVPNVRLADALQRAQIHPKMHLSEVPGAVAKVDATLGFRILFRPSLPEDEDRVLAINPHQRQDVEVCQTHLVDLYVGRHPYRAMPQESLTGMAVADAIRALALAKIDAAPMIVEGLVVSGADGGRRVVDQYPEPGQWLGRKTWMSRFEVPEQQPVLVVEPAAIPAPSCPASQPCQVAPVCPAPTDVGTKDSELWLGGVGGLAGGLALARVLRPASDAPVKPVPRDTKSQRMLVTRVRRDIDPLKPTLEDDRDD